VDSRFLLVVTVIGTALVAGLIVNRWVRPFADSEVKGVKLEALVGPLVSLTVLLLAFTLVTIFASFQRAQTGAAEEARKVDYQFEMALLTAEPQRQQMAAGLTCYAAAVANFEWETMAEGRTAPEVSPWNRQIDAAVAGIVASDGAISPVLSQLLTADRDRGEARSKRLTEARPAIPVQVKWLLVGTAAVGIFALAAFTLPYVGRRVQIGVLIALAGVFTMFLFVMLDLDRPYDGVVAIQPEDITRVAGDLAEDYAELFPTVPLPCDPTGLSLTA
jgi:hypothetical protein